MRRIVKSIVTLVAVIAIMQTSLPVLACSHTTPEGDVSPLCGSEILICDKSKPGEWKTDGTHTYGDNQNCHWDGYQRPTIVRCMYCGVRGSDDGFLHDCFISHDSCGAGKGGKVYICMIESRPTD